MNLGSLYAFITAIGFKANTLTVRLLQENGADKLSTYTIYRFALIPSAVWSLFFVRGANIAFIIHSPKLLIIFGLIIVFWNLQAYLRAQIMNSTNSMMLFSTIFNVLVFPLFLGFGVFINHDKANPFSIIAIAVLLLALLIRPTPHRHNVRPQLTKPLPLLVLLIFITAVCDTILQGVARIALQEIRPEVFLGVFSLSTLTVCWMISKLYIQPRSQPNVVMKQKQWLAVTLIPMTWFAASIPEAFSLTAIPIYTFISISVVTIGMDTVSDVMHKRIHFNAQTIVFLMLVVTGISLSVVSVG